MGSIIIARVVEGRAKLVAVNESKEPDLYRRMLNVYTEEKEGVWFQWPTEFPGILTQAFGLNKAYYGQFKCGGDPLLGHEGLDMRAYHGTEIYCCYDGVVMRAEDNEAAGGAYGKQVRVRHMINGVEYRTTYAHLDSVAVAVGDEVAKGQLLGYADDTGNSAGSHLHLTLKRMADNQNGWPCNIIDPTPYFKELR